MKKLAVVCLFVIAPLLLRAGSFDIVLNGGMVKNTAPLGYDWGIIKGAGASPAGSLRLMCNINKSWQVGMSVGYIPLTHTSMGSPLYFYDGDIVPQSSMTGTIQYEGYLANPAIPILIEGNHNVSIGKFEIYSGISAGMFVVYDWEKRSSEEYFGPYGLKGGLVGGMQAGGNWFLQSGAGSIFK